MPAQLPLASDRRLAAFTRVVEILASDPTFSGLAGQRIYNPAFNPYGGDDFLPDLGAGSVAVRLTPKLRPMEPIAFKGWGRRVYRAPLDVEFELRCGSDLWADYADAWSAIETALTGRDMQPAALLAFNAANRAAGIDDLELATPDDLGQFGVVNITTYVEG